MAAELGLRITGSVYWGALPVPNARLVLKAPGNYYKQPVLAETTAGPDGQFVLAQPPAGDFILYAVSPSPDYWEWSGHSLTVAAGQAVDAGRFELSKKLPLLEPGSDSTVPTLPTPTPVLRWTHFPDAARYAVDVFSDDTHAAVMRHSTTRTSVVVAPALAAGGRYQWSVSADDAQGRALARGGARHFRVQSVEGGAPIASLPTQAAAARQPAADSQRVSGWVAWGAVMVPGARVEMKALG